MCVKNQKNIDLRNYEGELCIFCNFDYFPDSPYVIKINIYRPISLADHVRTVNYFGKMVFLKSFTIPVATRFFIIKTKRVIDGGKTYFLLSNILVKNSFCHHRKNSAEKSQNFSKSETYKHWYSPIWFSMIVFSDIQNLEYVCWISVSYDLEKI